MKIIIREYWKIICQQKWKFFALIFFLLISNLSEIIAPIFYKDLANALAQGVSIEAENLAITAVIWVLGIYSLAWVAWRFFEFIILSLEVGGMKALSIRVFSVLQDQKYEFFQNEFSGSIVKKAGRFVSSFETVVDWVLFQCIGNLSLIVGAYIVFSWYHSDLALYFGVFTIVFLTFATWFSIFQFKYFAASAEYDSKISGVFADSFSNIFTVKTSGKEYQEKKIHNKVVKKWEEKTRFAWILMFIGFGVQAFLWIGFEGFLMFEIIEKWKAGNFTVGEFVLFQSVVFFVLARLWEFGRSLRNLFTALANAKEMADIIQKDEIEKDSENAKSFSLPHGAICFSNISFAYTENKVFEKTKLFENFSLDIQSGEKIALVGSSGSGKTTLTKLLFRFYSIDSGQILFDGKDSTEISLQSLRSQISLVPQRPELFHRSIRENLLFADPKATEEELFEALKKARAFDFVDNLPQKIDTMVGERGVKLSGGEAQRIALARSFLENTPIVVLDEATSALDSITEQQIQEGIFELIKDKTALVIAHRLSTILKMDRIIVMDDGKIIEQGTHQELLEHKGKYFVMWNHQKGKTSSEFLLDE